MWEILYVVVAADVLYDPLDVPALLDVAAALLGERRDEEGTTFFRRGDGGDAPREDEPFALFVSAVRQPATLALFARLAAERGRLGDAQQAPAGARSARQVP